MPHLTDRSRIMSGLQDCPTKRYWEYHSGQYQMGIVSKGFSIDLWTGITMHGMLETVLRLYKSAQDAVNGAQIGVEAVDRATLRAEIQASLASSIAEARAHGFEDESNTNLEFILKEQSSLAEGLVWGWIRACLPKFLQDYEIIAIEQELPLDVVANEWGNHKRLDIRLQTRPDIVLRSRSTGKLVIADWKSKGASKISDSYVKEFIDSVQMAVGTLATEKHFGEKVESYSIFVMLKGSREVFESRGKVSSTKRNYSHLLYAKFACPQPPFSDGSFELKGYWVDKQCSFEQEWLRTDPNQSIMEAWVERLPIETLWELYAEIGPYPRQDFMALDFLEVLKGEEQKWDKINTELKGAYPDSKLVPKSYECHKYGKTCSFYNLCFKVGDAYKDPVGSGKFIYRTPHHTDEMIQAEKNGVPLDKAGA
jgi:hypothetical protein